MRIQMLNLGFKGLSPVHTTTKTRVTLVFAKKFEIFVITNVSFLQTSLHQRHKKFFV